MFYLVVLFLAMFIRLYYLEEMLIVFSLFFSKVKLSGAIMPDMMEMVLEIGKLQQPSHQQFPGRSM